MFHDRWREVSIAKTDLNGIRKDTVGECDRV